jgi:hypothetical protein
MAARQMASKTGAAGFCNSADCAPEACRELVAGTSDGELYPRRAGLDTPSFVKYLRITGVDLPGFIARPPSVRRAACDQKLHGLRLRWAGPIAGHVARTVPGAYVKVSFYVCFFRQAPLRAH